MYTLIIKNPSNYVQEEFLSYLRKNDLYHTFLHSNIFLLKKKKVKK